MNAYLVIAWVLNGVGEFLQMRLVCLASSESEVHALCMNALTATSSDLALQATSVVGRSRPGAQSPLIPQVQVLEQILLRPCNSKALRQGQLPFFGPESD